MLLVLVALGAAFSVAIVSAAASGASRLRRRHAATDDEEDAAQGFPDKVEPSSVRSNADHFRLSLTAIACVLVLVLGSIALIARARWSVGLQKFPTGDGRFPCTASGGPDQLLQLGDLNGFQWSINTRSRLAQQLFNVGLLESYNFNQAEALRAFELAAKADPSAAMPHWGMTYSLGPGANRDVTETRQPFPSFCPEDFELAQAKAKTALELAQAAARAEPDAQVVQQDLAWAQAVSVRFQPGSALGPTRASAEEEYAEALVSISEKYNSTHASAIAAETYMNLSPWDYYKQPGELRETAAKAEALIEETLAQDPYNPLALHLHIHITEASTPQRNTKDLSAMRAEASADRLTGPGPWQERMGHLLHMPSHTFVRLGRWHDAVLSNQEAFQADLNDSRHCRSPYVPEHNLDMLIYAANMGGEVQQALRYAKAISGKPADVSLAMNENEGLGGWAALVLVHASHALWDNLLGIPYPPANARGNCPDGGFAYSVVVYHYARTLAFAARCRAAPDSDACRQADNELNLLQAAEGQVKQEQGVKPGPWPGIWACDYKNLTTIYLHTASAAVASKSRQFQLAEEELRKAAAIEDVMQYQEPPRLLQPVRHALGAVLLKAGKPELAEQAYRHDLLEHPHNGFSLLGLSQSLEAQGQRTEAQQALEEFQAAWRHADVVLTSSSPSFA